MEKRRGTTHQEVFVGGYQFTAPLPRTREADVLGWQLLMEASIAAKADPASVLQESTELLAIFTAIGKKLKT